MAFWISKLNKKCEIFLVGSKQIKLLYSSFSLISKSFPIKMFELYKLNNIYNIELMGFEEFLKPDAVLYVQVKNELCHSLKKLFLIILNQ